ncbi:MAG: cellulase family glycosylhydrolase [Candidatus Dormiibacterota bacterium]
MVEPPTRGRSWYRRRLWHWPRSWPRRIRGCCSCCSGCLVIFLVVSLALIVFALTPNFYPAYPSSARALPAESSTVSGHGLPWLHSNGTVILDSQGRQVLLRGMNVTGLEEAKDMRPGPVPTSQDFAEMAADGFDVVRLPINWSRLEPKPGRMSRSYLDLIRSVVNDAAAYGIYTILDLHNIDWSIYYAGDGAPSWAVAGGLPRSFPLGPPWNRHLAPGVLASYGIFWADLGGWQQDVTQVWSFVAQAFRNDSAVAGLDLWNEPHPFPALPGIFEKKSLLPFEADVITHLAALAPHQMWITEQTLDFGLPTYVAPLPYPNQVYSSHVFATLLEPPWQKPTPQYAIPLTLLEDQAKEAGAAPWVGEIGAGKGQSNQVWVAREMNELDRYKLGWAYWDWDEGGSWAFKRMTSRLRIVARAYPRATPGTLDTLSYDYKDGRLVVEFTGDASSHPLQVEVPSFYKGFSLTSSDPAKDVTSHLDASEHILTVRITDQDARHHLVIQLSS